VSARDVVEAAKNGYAYRPDDTGTTWTLIKKTPQSVLRIAPEAVHAPDVQEFVRVFRLRPGLSQLTGCEFQIPQNARRLINV